MFLRHVVCMRNVLLCIHGMFGVIKLQKNRKWYQTIWDFAWGKFLVDLWNEAVAKEKAKDHKYEHQPEGVCRTEKVKAR